MALTTPGYLAIFLWLVLSLAAFAASSISRAITFTLVTATLFLPVFYMKLPHIPELNKGVLSCSLALFLASMMGRSSLLKFRLNLLDIPMFFWLVSPLISSISNDLGVRDGLFETGVRFFEYVEPYLIGRIFFETRPKALTLILGIFIGGVCYTPFCIYELRMSPQLHNMVYGYAQHNFLQTMRGGGWRPMVFMEQGIILSLWMTIASLAGLWFWRTHLKGGFSQLYIKWAALILFTVSLMLKSLGAFASLFIGIFLLFPKNRVFPRILLLVLLALPCIFICGRVTGIFNGQGFVNFIGSYISVERAQSIWYRTYNELLLIERVMQRPIFGWGGHGRGFIFSEFSNRVISVTDSFWIIALSSNGLWGLTWAYTIFILPIALMLNIGNAEMRKIEPSDPLVFFTTLLSLHILDSVFNCSSNLVYLTALGSTTSLISAKLKVSKRKQKLKGLKYLFDENPPKVTKIRIGYENEPTS